MIRLGSIKSYGIVDAAFLMERFVLERGSVLL